MDLNQVLTLKLDNFHVPLCILVSTCLYSDVQLFLPVIHSLSVIGFPSLFNTFSPITSVTLPKSAPIPALTPVSTANPTTLPPVTSVVPSAISHASYSVKPKSIDFTGFDVFYLPLKQSR